MYRFDLPVDILSWFSVLAGILRRGVKGRLGDASDSSSMLVVRHGEIG